MFAAMIPAISSVLGSGGALGEMGGDAAATTDTVSQRTDVDVTQTAGGGSMVVGGSDFPIWIVLVVVAVLAVVVLKLK